MVVYRKKEHLRQCELLKIYLENLKAELEYTHAPFEKIANNLAENIIFCQFDFAYLCAKCSAANPFSWVFAEAVEQSRKLLGEEVCSSLGDLSGQLGNYSIENQISAITLCQHRVEQTIETIRTKTIQNIKLYHSLGLLGGCAAVILLW
jgi:stage III sporulation protein AB